MEDLISRKAVEQAIKEFNKKRVDKIPRGLSFEEHNKILNIISEENDEMLKIINDMPTAYDAEKVDKQIVEYFKTQIENVDAWKVVDFSHDIRKIVRNGGKE